MRIGLISEMYGGITTPPIGYGGIGRTMHHIENELIRQGHDTTMFAIEGSWSNNRLVVCPPWDNNPTVTPNVLPPYAEITKQHIDKIDVWIDGSHHHCWARWLEFNMPQITAICMMWNPNSADKAQNPILQSPHMREGTAASESAPVFYAGVPTDEYIPNYDPAQGLVAIHSLGMHKGVDMMVKTAVRYNLKLDLYGHFADEISRSKVLPFLSDKIVWHGLIRDERKEIFGDSMASLCLATWPEPGSLASIESMMCGCPVIATRAGCFPYYIQDGVNGYLVDFNEESVMDAYGKIMSAGSEIRKSTRALAEQRFSIKVYVDNILKTIDRVISGERWH